MRTSLSSDPAHGAGHAIIRLHTGDVSVPSMPEGGAFSLQRASDALFLAQHGWQESHSSQVPDSISKQGSLLELHVGPHVVDNLDMLDTYRIQLQHSTLPASVLEVESLNYSPLKGKEGLATAGRATPQEPVVLIAPVAAEPDPEPEPVSDIVFEPPQPMAAPPVTDVPLSMTPQSPAPQEAKKSPLLWLMPLLVLLIAGSVYYWYSGQPASTNAAPETGTPEVKPEVVQPLAQARKQLQGTADAAQSLALARSLQAQKPADPAMAAQNADAVFLLAEDAAQKGSAEAMLLLGQYFDPASTVTKGSIQPDATQACHWYMQARAGGQNEVGEAADAALAALRVWAEAAAAQGDIKAQEVLTQLPTK